MILNKQALGMWLKRYSALLFAGLAMACTAHAQADSVLVQDIAGRSVRPMTVSVRPGKPNGAASGCFSGMVRAPLAGIRAQVPVAADTPVALASPGNTIAGFVRAAQASDAQWGPPTAINLPSFRTTVGAMAQALQKIGGRVGAALLDWTPDPAIEKLVSSWPGNLSWERARGLGLQSDADFEAVIRDYERENPDAVKLPVQ